MSARRTGILIEARNGPVVGYDETGLRLRLSDDVLADIAQRLPRPETPRRVPASRLGDIDAWSVEEVGDFYVFDAKLPAYPFPRRFRRHSDGTGVFADPPGTLTGLLGLGAPRAVAHPDRTFDHPAHLVTADDDIGAVGMGGAAAAPVTARLHPVRHATLDAVTGDLLVGRRAAAGRALPLLYLRTETDSSGSAGALATGIAIANLATAIGNLVAAALSLGVPAQLAAVTLDYAADDVLSDDPGYVAGMLAVMDAVAAICARHDLRPPVFLAETCDTGARAAAQWHLALFPRGHRLIFTGPGAGAECGPTGRLTAAGLADLAEHRARVLDTLLSGGEWTCPRLLHAERRGDGVRVICDGAGPLTLAPGATGFAGAGARLQAVIAADDPLALDLTGPGVAAATTLDYGLGNPGAIRDAAGRAALPARLAIR